MCRFLLLFLVTNLGFLFFFGSCRRLLFVVLYDEKKIKIKSRAMHAHKSSFVKIYNKNIHNIKEEPTNKIKNNKRWKHITQNIRKIAEKIYNHNNTQQFTKCALLSFLFIFSAKKRMNESERVFVEKSNKKMKKKIKPATTIVRSYIIIFFRFVCVPFLFSSTIKLGNIVYKRRRKKRRTGGEGVVYFSYDWLVVEEPQLLSKIKSNKPTK